MSAASVSARFEEFDGHRSVVVRWSPSDPPRSQALFVPAFGDEMNQTRRMVRMCAEALAARGTACTIFDLFGTGDSSADFADATVERWLADCAAMIERTRAASNAPLVLVGCRLGVGLAVCATQSLEVPIAGLVGWAPVLEGKQQLSAMLRVARVARMQRASTDDADPKAAWAAGDIVDLGGYPISPALARGLESLSGLEAPRARRTSLLEVRVAVDGTPLEVSPLLRERARVWSGRGTSAQVAVVAGAGFWNVSDLIDVPELIERTLGEVAAIES